MQGLENRPVHFLGYAQKLGGVVGAGGEFTVVARAPGLYRLRSERIGYRASESPPIDLTGVGTIDVVFRVTPIPVELAAIEIRDERRCDMRPAEDTTTALVWEEVRKALEAAQWTARQNYQTRILIYEREMDASRRRVRSEAVRTRAGPMRRSPFSSLPAENLAQHGFVVEQRGETWYYAPDAEVLLDDAFLDTHCFHLVRGAKDREGLIGLAFEPTPGRSVAEVRGVIWLDLRSAELQELEYRYTNMPWQISDDRVGGTVWFLQLPSGLWIVREWQIRIPQIAYERRRGDPLLDDRPRAKVTAFYDTGGEVFEISAHRGVPVFKASMARIAGTVIDSTTGDPLPGARITLEGTDLITVTDAQGAFTLEAPFTGDYSFAVEHPRLDTIGIATLYYPVALERGAALTLRFGLPHADSVAARLCPDTPPSVGDGARYGARVIFGVVRERRTGNPVAKAKVHAVWQRITVSPTALNADDIKSVATADGTGFYVICGLPVGRPVEVWTEQPGLASQRASLLFPLVDDTQLLLGWDKPVGRPYDEIHSAPYQGWRLDLNADPTAAGDPAEESIALSGIVVDAQTAEPIPEVLVTVNGQDTTTTQQDGTFAVPSLVWNRGVNRVHFRRLGFQPIAYDVEVGREDAAVVLNVPLAQMPINMEEIVVEGESVAIPSYLRGFYERRSKGAGTYLTQEDIQSRMATRLIDLLRTLPGIDLTGRRQDILFFRRANPNCKTELKPPMIILDGLPLGGAVPGEEVTSLIETIDPYDLVGIEVYQGPSEVPAQFNRLNAECGLIVIWTNIG